MRQFDEFLWEILIEVNECISEHVKTGVCARLETVVMTSSKQYCGDLVFLKKEVVTGWR